MMMNRSSKGKPSNPLQNKKAEFNPLFSTDDAQRPTQGEQPLCSVKSLPQALVITVDYAQQPAQPEVFIQNDTLHLVAQVPNALGQTCRVETEIPFSEPIKGQISLVQSHCQISMILPKNQPVSVGE